MSTLSQHSFGDHSPIRPAVGASAAGFEQGMSHAALRRVETKEFLFAEGDEISHVYRVETGAIALYKVLADGRRQVMGFAYPGDLIGLGIEGEHGMNAQAIKPTRVRCLPVASLRRAAARDPMLGFKLYESLARELAATAQRRRACRRFSVGVLPTQRTQRSGSREL